MKKIIRLTENDLHKIVKNIASKVIKEEINENLTNMVISAILRNKVQFLELEDGRHTINVEDKEFDFEIDFSLYYDEEYSDFDVEIFNVEAFKKYTDDIIDADFNIDRIEDALYDIINEDVKE